MSRTEVLSGMRRRRTSYLQINTPESSAQNYPLTGAKIIIGRSDENEITLPFTNVSRNHASIFSRAEEYFVEDLGSTNGTYVNGVKVAKCVLRPNDLIQIGETKMYYHEQEELCIE